MVSLLIAFASKQVQDMRGVGVEAEVTVAHAVGWVVEEEAAAGTRHRITQCFTLKLYDG